MDLLKDKGDPEEPPSSDPAKPPSRWSPCCQDNGAMQEKPGSAYSEGRPKGKF